MIVKLYCICKKNTRAAPRTPPKHASLFFVWWNFHMFSFKKDHNLDIYIYTVYIQYINHLAKTFLEQFGLVRLVWLMCCPYFSEEKKTPTQNNQLISAFSSLAHKIGLVWWRSWMMGLDEANCSTLHLVLLRVSMEVRNQFVSWFITYWWRRNQPTYVGVIIHLLSTMDIPVPSWN